jgi:thiol-disulfide isomerase/thioredoxin
MKSLKTIFTTLLVSSIFSFATFGQSTAKIVAIVNTAEWCSVCKAHGQRAMGAFMEANKDGKVKFIFNDLTNAESQRKAALELKKVGFSTAMKPYKAAGVAYFFDAKTKAAITQITVANSNDEIAYIMAEVQKTAK